MNNITTNLDLINIIKKFNIKNFNGVYSKDQLKKPLKRGFYIINLADSVDEGTHWTALYIINDNFSIYYDSFGFPAPEDIENIINKNYIYNKQQIQNIDSSSCGFYCIAFIKFLSNKQDKLKSFNTFLKLFGNNTNDNEIILHKLLYT